MDSAPIIDFEKQITPTEKKFSRSFNLLSDKKSKYQITIYNEQNKLVLSALNLNSKDLKSNEYKKETLINELRNNKYLSLCENNNDMLEELFNLIDNKKYTLNEEKDNEIILSIEVPMKKIKEITFNLEKKEKDTNTIINDLITKNNELKSKIDTLNLQSKDLKDDIDYLKFKNNDKKFTDLFNELNGKIDNLELKINQKKLEEQKEKNNLISQVNILTKKVIQLEKDLEQEKINGKKIMEKINQLNRINNNNSNNKSSNNNNVNNNKANNESQSYRMRKSETLPNLFFENFFEGILGNPNSSKLGRKGRSKFHEHVLTFSNYTMKDPSYAIDDYQCDHCKEEFSRKVDNFHCKPCHFDLCERCFKLSQY